MGVVYPVRILPTAIQRPTHIALTIPSRGRCRIERPATERGGKVRATPEAGDPAPRAAGRASNMFSSAGEQSEDTQGQRRIQAAEAACQASSSRTVASVCDDLLVKAIVHASALAESCSRSRAQAAPRRDRLTLKPDLQQPRLAAVEAFPTFTDPGEEPERSDDDRGAVRT
jgi:hypothetical protein